MTFDEFKTKIKEKLKNDNIFRYADNEDDNFIWIGTKDRLIGNDTCHYEFYMEEKKYM